MLHLPSRCDLLVKKILPIISWSATGQGPSPDTLFLLHSALPTSMPTIGSEMSIHAALRNPVSPLPRPPLPLPVTRR